MYELRAGWAFTIPEQPGHDWRDRAIKGVEVWICPECDYAVCLCGVPQVRHLAFPAPKETTNE